MVLNLWKSHPKMFIEKLNERASEKVETQKLFSTYT
jgi:hypothetical protein